MSARARKSAGVPVRTPAVVWDRSGCREQVCVCHDAPPYANACRWCGCQPTLAIRDETLDKICGTCGDLRARCTGDADTYEEPADSTPDEDEGERSSCEECGESFNSNESGSDDYCLRCLPTGGEA